MQTITQTTTELPALSPATKPLLTLTPKAIAMAKERLNKRDRPDAALRLGVRGGGCSGFNYVIEVHDGPARERDHVYDFDGLRVVVDKKSIVHLAGSVLDWEQTLMQRGFKFKNPREASSCGCGHSFTVKLQTFGPWVQGSRNSHESVCCLWFVAVF